MDNIVGKAVTTEAAQAASLGVITVVGKSALDKEEKDKSPVKEVQESSMLALATKTKSQAEAGAGILRNLMEKLAQSGMSLDRLSEAEKGELRLLEDAGITANKDTKVTDDVVQISAKSAQKAFKQSVKQMQLTSNIDFGNASEPQKEVMKEYAVQYYAFLATDDPNARKKLKKTEEKLKEAGVSDDRIFSVAKQVKSAIRSDIAIKLKENMLLNDLSDSNIESMKNQVAVNSVIKAAVFGEQFGDLEQTRDILNNIVDEAKDENAKEISRYLLEELESKMIEKMAKGEKDYKDLDKLIDLAVKTDTDLATWLNGVWPHRKEDLGLTKTDMPLPGQNGMVDTDTDGQSGGKRDQEDDTAISTDEKEIMANQLRALYTQRIMKGDAATHVRTMFKIMRLKNGLVKLGVYNKEFDEKLTFQSEVIARKKITEMLKEAILEKSALFQLKGTPFNIVENKIKNYLETAKRLNIEINKEDIERMQYNADSRMLDIVKEQVKMYAPAMKRIKDVKMIKIFKRLQDLQERLIQATSVKGVSCANEDLTSEVI